MEERVSRQITGIRASGLCVAVLALGVATGIVHPTEIAALGGNHVETAYRTITGANEKHPQAICRDGVVSFLPRWRPGTCDNHGGVDHWLH
jgi:Protein of unknown function (DUF3761)